MNSPSSPSGQRSNKVGNETKNDPDGSSHISRKSRYEETKAGDVTNNNGGGDQTSGRRKSKGSRSRSNGDKEAEERKRPRVKGTYDGIPQKYLSLLNIPGEGRFESPGLSRSKTLREPRRQRPSRLTSNLTDYKAIVYVPCVRLALSELLVRCNTPRMRHYYVAAAVLMDLLTLSNLPHDQNFSFDSLLHWVITNREDICIIFDNVDGSESWERLISDAFHDRDGFGKMIAATTPGRISKRDVDSLFYCYGLSSEYSNKSVLSRLRAEAPEVENRIAFLLTSNHTQELLCNPLSTSLLSAYFRSVKPGDKIPEHLSELLEHLVSHAMSQESNTIKMVVKANKTRRRRFSLLNLCETIAFECLENDTNYFSKQKFPPQFWSRHLCDCRLMHEVHEIANFSSIHEHLPSPVTSRLCLTPDSDSVHSNASSDAILLSDVTSSTQSLNNMVDSDRSSCDPRHSDSDTSLSRTSSPILLQVPSLKPTDASTPKHASERPKSLLLDARRPHVTSRQSSQTQTSGDIVSFTSRCVR